MSSGLVFVDRELWSIRDKVLKEVGKVSEFDNYFFEISVIGKECQFVANEKRRER